MRLSSTQKGAVIVGRPDKWLGTREVNVAGNTMYALEGKGLAVVRETRRPYRRLVYRLTDAGNALRVEWALAEAGRPVEHVPVRVRCTFCGAEFPDGTVGGSCGECGQAVAAA